MKLRFITTVWLVCLSVCAQSASLPSTGASIAHGSDADEHEEQTSWATTSPPLEPSHTGSELEIENGSGSDYEDPLVLPESDIEDEEGHSSAPEAAIDQNTLSSVFPSLSQKPVCSISRSCKILLVGLKDGGKSLLLSQILRQQYTPTSGSITEYVLTNTTAPAGANEFRIIDTPDFTGSPRNGSHDARIFATLINHYAESSNQAPDSVLIFLPCEEDLGIQAEESKTLLRRFTTLRDVLLQIENGVSFAPNVVFIATKSSEVNSTEDVCKSDLERNNFRDAIITETGDNKPVLTVFSLDSSGGLSTCNTSSNVSRSDLPLQLLNQLSSSVANLSVDIQEYPLMSTNDLDPIHRVLEVWAAAEIICSHPSNEVTDILKVTYETKMSLRQKYPGSLQLLQALMLTRNITERSRVPRADKEITRFLYNASGMYPATITLLQTAFPVVVPDLPFDPLVGQGYDPTIDSPMESPFSFDELEFCNLGFMVPRSLDVTLRPIPVEVNNIKFHTTTKLWIASRMNELNLATKLNETNFKGDIRPGDIVLSAIKGNGATRVRISGTREIQAFQITLKNEAVKFKTEFRDLISTMPVYNVHDRDSVQEWRALFEQYGTHVVTSAFGGGVLEAVVELKNQELRAFRSGNVTTLRRVFESVLSNPAQFVNSNSNMTVLSLNVKGGESQFQDLNFINLNRTAQTKTLESWKESLRFEPVMLQTKLVLVSMAEFVRTLNVTAANELARASNALLEGSLKYVPLPIPTTVAPVPVPKIPVQVSQTQVRSSTSQPGQVLKLKRAGDSVLPAKTVTPGNAIKPSAPISQSALRSMLPTREDFEQNNKLLECLQGFIQSLDQQIQTSPDDSTLVELANDIEQLYNQIASIGTVKPREKLLIEVICLNLSKTQSLPLEQLKNLVHFQEDLKPEQQEQEPETTNEQEQIFLGNLDGFPETHAANSRSADMIGNMRRIAGSVWRLDNLPASPKQVTDCKFIGFGYDLLWDRVTSLSPFLLTENSFTKINLRSFPQPEVIFRYFDGKSDYVSERLRSLVPNSFRQIMPSKFRGRTLPGHAYNDLEYVSIVLEYRKALVRLSLDEPIHLRLNEVFETEVSKLPTQVDWNNCTLTNAWKRFLNRYGTHTVSEAFLGGAIEVVGRGQLKETLLQFRDLSASPSGMQSVLQSVCRTANCTFRVIGGDSSLFEYQTSFTPDELDSWIESITNNMVALPTRIKLKNMHKIFQTFMPNASMDITTQFLDAVNKYHTDEIRACRGSIRCEPFLVYNETSAANAECVCPAGQIWNTEYGNCETLVGQNCSTSSWDNCVQNAMCSASVSTSAGQNDYSVCKCRQGFDEAVEPGKCSMALKGIFTNVKVNASGNSLDDQPGDTSAGAAAGTLCQLPSDCNATMTCNSEERCQNGSMSSSHLITS